MAKQEKLSQEDKTSPLRWEGEEAPANTRGPGFQTFLELRCFWSALEAAADSRHRGNSPAACKSRNNI